ncbi:MULTISPECIES: o-succinylbenzoate synthase [Trueperella]|uniref:o-succinylbenzoate synthase n=1 Tax=Trueperella bernardiae TaxID=59561 RepID=A0AAW6ZBS8_9ACTO|nr:MULTISPECIES: o-succinylbenzoate synthase [Trueperella]MCM3906731.1 o-succinylbenzoate synthase [Trueperella bernardiae]MDK8601441.1 o-succinylbenzoate synthase [Trueperella bernardiae]MDV6238126.1 o-succinylbenzoate synthase [Trueperella bernardiae]OCW60717.1 O-succinylbenzoate synthase [Trueperella bernardiae]OFS67793.1 O-succinylbenzoate synthase [Trueperella sp. HMSC08H06]
MKFYVYRLALKNRFRRLTERDGLLVKGERWGEVSPFWDYDAVESARWLAAGVEAAAGLPAPLRGAVPVNETIPAVDAEVAYALAAASSCATFKVKIADHAGALAEDLARLEAVRAAQPAAKIRVDANAAWDVDTAVAQIRQMDRAAGRLEYVEQPCPGVEDLAKVRRRVDVPIAADESIRRGADPLEVVRREAADVAVLKNQPLGGVRAALALAEALAMPVVVSSALESSVGLRAGLAFAAALPELPHACGLATTRLFVDDVVAEPLAPKGGQIAVRDVVPDPARSLPVGAELACAWERRLAQMWEVAEGAGHVRGEYEFMGGLA